MKNVWIFSEQPWSQSEWHYTQKPCKSNVVAPKIKCTHSCSRLLDVPAEGNEKILNAHHFAQHKEEHALEIWWWPSSGSIEASQFPADISEWAWLNEVHHTECSALDFPFLAMGKCQTFKAKYLVYVIEKQLGESARVQKSMKHE